MSALDWSMWLRSGAITGPRVNREFRQTFHPLWLKAPPVKLNRFVMVHICDTTKSAEVGW